MIDQRAIASTLTGQEYLVWRVYDRQFDWFRLQGGEYIQLEPNVDGIICSEIFSGLWLEPSAIRFVL